MFIFVTSSTGRQSVCVGQYWDPTSNLDSGLGGWEEEGMMHEQDAGCSTAALAATLWGLDVVVNRKSLLSR